MTSDDTDEAQEDDAVDSTNTSESSTTTTETPAAATASTLSSVGSPSQYEYVTFCLRTSHLAGHQPMVEDGALVFDHNTNITTNHRHRIYFAFILYLLFFGLLF